MVNVSRYQMVALVVVGALAFGIIAAATVLCALHDLDAQAVVALYGSAIGLVGGGAGSLAAVSSATNGKSVIANGHLSDLVTALEHATSSLAGGHATTSSAATAATEPAA